MLSLSRPPIQQQQRQQLWTSTGPSAHGSPVRRASHWGQEGVQGASGVMALCSEACVSGGDSSGSETGSSCLQFGVRSYLHHFYEECSSSVWERDPEDRGFVQSQRSALWWNSAVWKVSLALGLLILTAGIASLSVGSFTPHKIESFGEGDLLFVDTHAISFNRGLHLSAAAGIGLSCLGSALLAMGVVVWILPRANLKERLFHRPGEGEGRGELRSKGRGFRDPGDVVTKPPGIEEGKIPVTLSKVENVQPTS
ncbi:neurensin 1-like isoform X1 [Hippoglossus hippoglossus]|uniref:neurensin 1-like isoform X1 n=1 Tax=Hippoglossus hippoglossus TaxID=8267 RepID=UPI00148E88EB|nr:neurensin 1-like isoform X1 [Hippoglossus hippoglossus]